MCGSMVDIQSVTAENRRGKEDRRKKKKPQDENIMSASATHGGHNQAIDWLKYGSAIVNVKVKKAYLYRAYY